MNKLISSVSPHITSSKNTTRIMLDVIIALIPAAVASVIIFGLRALLVIGVCVGVCVFSEWGFEKLVKKENTITDLSAVVTGMLLAFNLPVGIPLWQAAFGSIVAIVVVKQLRQPRAHGANHYDDRVLGHNDDMGDPGLRFLGNAAGTDG